MCGIAGIWGLKKSSCEENIIEMLNAIAHRGPDGRGSLCFEGGAAGMVRLALVDLTERGQQPLWSEDKGVALIFNGEMYNFRQEKARLEMKGYSFRTETDTEVVLALYLEDDRNFEKRMEGMYAIAIFDWRAGRLGGLPVLTLIRDPLGIKPLYVAGDGSGQPLVFGSELRALLASGLVNKEVNRDALVDYLRFGYVFQHHSIIEGVRCVNPGTKERYAPDGELTTSTFWRCPEYQPQVESLEDASQRLRVVLEQSVRSHALADAPVGAFLSGGVDSAAVVAMMRPHVPNLHTYTLRFDQSRPGKRDESEEAQRFAKMHGCQHTTVEITGREIPDLVTGFAGALDQPSIDGFNTWLISRAAARDVKAVLSGLGGDENFAGYFVTRKMSYLNSTMAGRVRQMLGRSVNTLSWAGSLGLTHSPRLDRLRAERSMFSQWFQTRQFFPEHTVRSLMGMGRGLYSPEKGIERLLEEIAPLWKTESAVGLSFMLDINVYMRMQLLRTSDVLSMAHSLELRVPLATRELAEFSRSCLDQYKLTHGGTRGSTYDTSGSKRVLIEATKDLLPAGIADRPKQGFSLPTHQWLKNDLATYVQDTCNIEALKRRGWFENCALERLFNQGAMPYDALWNLFILELWAQAVMD